MKEMRKAMAAMVLAVAMVLVISSFAVAADEIQLPKGKWISFSSSGTFHNVGIMFKGTTAVALNGKNIVYYLVLLRDNEGGIVELQVKLKEPFYVGDYAVCKVVGKVVDSYGVAAVRLQSQ